MIYFVSAGSQFIKIGTSFNLNERVKGLQTANPKRLKIKAVLEGGFKTESELHNMFAKAKTRGEWFKSTEELKWFIRAIQENPNIKNIYTLYRISQQMRLNAKAKRLGKDHKLSKRIGRYAVQIKDKV